MDTLRPPALRPGDMIGIVSTSSPVSEHELARLIGYLRGRDYRVKLADGVGDRLGYFAGSAERRAAGVMAMFADPEVAMVLSATGRTGAARTIWSTGWTTTSSGRTPSCSPGSATQRS